MREAMALAPLGDDVYGEDETVNALERKAAELCGREAGLFVPSGTMANQIGVRLWAGQGDEVYAHVNSHVLIDEAGGTAALWGAHPRGLHSAGYDLDVEELLHAVPMDASDIHQARQSLVCIENTVGEQGGLIYPQERIDVLAAFAHERGMRLHMDGARLWNAAVASGSDPARIVRDVDSISICFSKGLGAPVGSAVAGSTELVESGRRSRKLLGGGMRQAGIIAAGALYAIRHNIERLADDHANARTLAESLAGGTRMRCDPDRVETNIVFGEVGDGMPSAELVEEMAAAGVLCSSIDERTIRFVTHLDVDADAVSAVIERLRPMLR